MNIEHLEILVEEPSAEAFLLSALPRILPAGIQFSLYTYNGKSDLLRKLPDRLRGYSKWLPPNYGIVVIIDNDRGDCAALKAHLEALFFEARIATKNCPCAGGFSGLTRIAIEELEAWYFGNWDAVRRTYPNLPTNVPKRAAYRRSDSISGGTWEAFERVCQQNGLFLSGLRKVEAARAIGSEVALSENSSPSFGCLCNGLLSLVGQN